MKKSQKPELRFPGFTDEWKSYKLGSFSDIKSGYTFPPKYQGKKNEKWLYVKVADIGNRDVIKYLRTTINSVSSEIMHELNAKPFRAGCTVFPRVGAALLNNNKRLLHRDSLIDDNVLAVNIIDLKKCDDEFFFYWFLTKHLSKFCNNGQVPVISARRVKAYSVPIPSIVEQKKIAQFLTTIDTRLQQLTRKVALLEDYKKGVLQQLFSRRIRFRDEQGEDFPEWEERRLGKLTYKVGKRNKENVNYPIYSINNKEGFLPQADQFDGVDSNERGYDISLYKIIKSNTFAYNPARINVGSIGYSGALNNVIISSLYVCFKTKDELDDHYLLAYLDTYEFNKAVLRNAEGGVRSYLFYENFSNIKIPVPSLAEQQKIATFLSTIDRKVELVRKELEQTQEYKKGLLQQMFV